VLERFRVADATAPERAQSLESLGLGDSMMLRRLIDAGVIRPGSSGNRVYLSETTYATYRRRTRVRAVIFALVAGLAMLILGFAAFVVTARQIPRPPTVQGPPR